MSQFSRLREKSAIIDSYQIINFPFSMILIAKIMIRIFMQPILFLDFPKHNTRIRVKRNLK